MTATLQHPGAVLERLEAIDHDLAVRQRIVVASAGFSTRCWIWTKATNNGYGDGWFGGEHMLAHRWTFREFYGWLPDYPDWHIDHLCRQTKCCNPEHLEAVRPTVNSRRSTKAKLTVEQIGEILGSRDSYRALAQRYGVTHQTIYYYKSGKYARRKARWPT